MKKQLLAIVFICVTSISWSQINEIGVFIGGSNYIGDVGKSNLHQSEQYCWRPCLQAQCKPKNCFKRDLKLYIRLEEMMQSRQIIVRVNRRF